MNRVTSRGPWPDWDDIDHVLLDMDGTLLNLGFDNEFFSEFLPAQYALANEVTEDAAQEDLFARYKAVEGTLQWFDIEYWGRELGLDVVGLTEQQSHKVSLHPDADAFLKHMQKLGKPAHLVTNAHHTTLAIKSSGRELISIWKRCCVPARSAFPNTISVFGIMRRTKSTTIPTARCSWTIQKKFCWRHANTGFAICSIDPNPASSSLRVLPNGFTPLRIFIP